MRSLLGTGLILVRALLALLDFFSFVRDGTDLLPTLELNVLVTDPRHQRRGAGSLLIAHVCKEADERNLLCRLTASQAGLAAYLKHGFEVKKIVPLDLRPYGFDSIEDRRFMLRPAKDAAA